jgi:hypothetical protein
MSALLKMLKKTFCEEMHASLDDSRYNRGIGIRRFDHATSIHYHLCRALVRGVHLPEEDQTLQAWT